MVFMSCIDKIIGSSANSFIAMTKQCPWNLGIPKWLHSQGSKTFAIDVVNLVTLLKTAMCNCHLSDCGAPRPSHAQVNHVVTKQLLPPPVESIANSSEN